MTVDIMKEIYDGILEGKVDEVAADVQKALNSEIAAEDILNQVLIPAMDLVGERFGEGEIFIPQVLWSAKAMQAGMVLLKPRFTSTSGAARGKVVIGTAKGDIHDIGKNLVAIMLEGAGLQVIDLGVDVSPERFVDAAVEQGAEVIAISALLTTTMQSMGEVVSLIRKRDLPSLKVIIGGAPVDMTFCRKIGADAYGMDAMDGMKKVRELLKA
ncbi:MAG: corrinoid protein [Desulfobacterales bacterium]|nr:corrinoid protein [Desulfobacterales bacterium]